MITKTYFKTKDYSKVKFSLDLENAESVKILGLNNDWETPIVMTKKKGGTFSTEVSLPKDARHEFKYLVNDTEWITDPSSDEEAYNEFGTVNSVITV